jgi:hypothetical protein
MRKNVEYAVARRNGPISVSLDEAGNLLEDRRSTDPPERDGGGGTPARENSRHHRVAAGQPRSDSRQQAYKAGRRVRRLLSRAWHSLFPVRGPRDDPSAP